MLYEDNYLAHYGIKLQRWGIRRYQNEDGSLTPEGRKRYHGFEKTKAHVSNKMSNKVNKFERKPVDIDKVKERGNLSTTEAKECASLASRLFRRAERVEPEITKDIVSVVQSNDGHMYGLDNRLKQPTSIAAKIGSDAKENNISFEEAAYLIRDAIRYTGIFDDNNFVDCYNSIKDSLERKGYSELRCKNYYQFYKDGTSKHKAVQCTYSDPNGNIFEFQFHTPSSQTAKELKIPLYEERRKAGLSPKQIAELEKKMSDLAEQVPNPKGIFSIQSH